MRNATIFLALAFLLGACAAPTTPAPAPTSAPTQSLTNTPEATLSPTPAPSNTLEATATLTPAPTSTLELALRITPTFLFRLPTQTATKATLPLDCQLLTQSVTNGDKFRPGERFSMSWQVANSGTASWYPGTVQFTYVGGTKMYQYPQSSLQSSVGPGETISLNADLRAPNNSSKYTTVWSLRQGTTYFCYLRVTIFVTTP